MREPLARCMTRIAVWALDFKTRQYLKGSLWFLPLLGGITGALLGLLEPVLARRISMPMSLEYSASTASVLLASIVGATAALTGFVVTVSVLVVQMATSMLSARYMRLWYRDRVLHILLALLVGTFTFSFTLLAGVEENSVPHVGVTATGVLMAADLFLFLFFLDRFVHRLRPVAVAALAAAAGRQAFESDRPGGEWARRARDRARAAGDRRRADDGRAHAQRRLDPGDRRHGSRSVRTAAPEHARAQPCDRRLRPGRSGRDPGLRGRADR